jgi:hypothetical protein
MTTPDAGLRDIFSEVAAQMTARFTKSRAALDHSGLKGRANEEVVREFLRDHLPRQLDVYSGQIIDTLGRQSREMDVIISDSLKTPVFYDDGGSRVVPVEPVYSIVEVKAHLDTEELQRSILNMKSVKRLSKEAYYRQTGPVQHTTTMFGDEWDIWPLTYFIFAFESIDLNLLTEKLHEHNDAGAPPLSERVDMICVLDKGIVCNRSDDGSTSPTPFLGTNRVAMHSENALFLFYLHLIHLFTQVRLPHLRITDYGTSVSSNSQVFVPIE